MPSAHDFQRELTMIFKEAEQEGRQYVDVRSGDLHRKVGDYPGYSHRMSLCCEVMKKAMRPGDQILQQPPSGLGANLVVRYMLPRERFYRPTSETQDLPEVPDGASWFDRCPVCRLGKLSRKKRRFLGIVVGEDIRCDRCGAVFTKRKEGYELSEVSDVSNPTWQEYGGQVLTEREWRNIAYGGMSDAKQRERDLEHWMEELRKGEVQLRVEGEAPIILRKGENLLLVLPEVSLLELRSVRMGTYGGPTVRVAKGIHIRLGGFTAESNEELRFVDQGVLVLTNRRLVFSGMKRTIEVGLGQIISLEAYKDGVVLKKSGRNKPYYFIGFDKVKVKISVADKTYWESFSGAMLKCAVEGLIKKA